MINLKFLNTLHNINMPHTTGCWHMLRAKAVEKFERLQDNDFFFVDQETKKDEIDEEFKFNDMINNTTPNNRGQRVIGLLARIKGVV